MLIKDNQSDQNLQTPPPTCETDEHVVPASPETKPRANKRRAPSAGDDDDDTHVPKNLRNVRPVRPRRWPNRARPSAIRNTLRRHVVKKNCQKNGPALSVFVGAALPFSARPVVALRETDGLLKGKKVGYK